MIKEFRLPDLGEGLTESEILSWKVAVGDTVTLNQVIAGQDTTLAQFPGQERFMPVDRHAMNRLEDIV